MDLIENQDVYLDDPFHGMNAWREPSPESLAAG